LVTVLSSAPGATFVAGPLAPEGVLSADISAEEIKWRGGEAPSEMSIWVAGVPFRRAVARDLVPDLPWLRAPNPTVVAARAADLEHALPLAIPCMGWSAPVVRVRTHAAAHLCAVHSLGQVAQRQIVAHLATTARPRVRHGRR
jgi:hypothetical protein